MKKLWIVVLVFSTASLSETNRPHIITILVDDLGWNDFGYQGSEQIKTPNIDALAYSGMILHRHYVLPTCTPSRAALLTGYYPIKTGLQGYPLKAGENRNLPLDFKLKPAYLKDLGYKTHLVGKWHLGFETFKHVPNHRGFDTFFGYYNGYVDYYKYYYNQSLDGFNSQILHGYDLHYNNDAYWINDKEYATRVFTKRAVKVIKEHDESQPLYLYMSHLATHTGNENQIGVQAPEDLGVNKSYSHIRDYGRRVFAGCLEELDKSIGTLIKTLKEKNMLENSIILLLSDNGGHTVSVDMAPNWSSNWPLAGIKFTMFEGGIRGGALVWSPFLPKGVLNTNFIHITDWLPTLYSAAGGDTRNLGNIDGINQWKALQRTSAVERDNILINIDDKTGAEGIIIDNRWKIIKGGTPGYGFYDYHWGREESFHANLEYDMDAVLNSETGKILLELPEYIQILKKERISKLRAKAKIGCRGPIPMTGHKVGYVNSSSDYRCSKYCVFDLKTDPCEIESIENEDILRKARILLEEYKKKVCFPGTTVVDPKSDPEKFGGVWTPWRSQHQQMSAGKDCTSQHIILSFVLAISWYTLKIMYV